MYLDDFWIVIVIENHCYEEPLRFLFNELNHIRIVLTSLIYWAIGEIDQSTIYLIYLFKKIFNLITNLLAFRRCGMHFQTYALRIDLALLFRSIFLPLELLNKCRLCQLWHNMNIFISTKWDAVFIYFPCVEIFIQYDVILFYHYAKYSK